MAILVGQSEAGWLKKLGKSIVSIFDIMSLVLPEKIVIVQSVSFRECAKLGPHLNQFCTFTDFV